MHTFRQSGSPTIEKTRTQLTFVCDAPPNEEWRLAFALEFLRASGGLRVGMNIDSFGQDGVLAVSIESANPEHITMATATIQSVTDSTNQH